MAIAGLNNKKNMMAATHTHHYIMDNEIIFFIFEMEKNINLSIYPSIYVSIFSLFEFLQKKFQFLSSVLFAGNKKLVTLVFFSFPNSLHGNIEGKCGGGEKNLVGFFLYFVIFWCQYYSSMPVLR